jgi:hypothetical protein
MMRVQKNGYQMGAASTGINVPHPQKCLKDQGTGSDIRKEILLLILKLF